LSQIGLGQLSSTSPTVAGKSAWPYFMLLLVVIATVLGVLVAMNKLRVPGINRLSPDAGGDDLSTVVDALQDADVNDIDTGTNRDSSAAPRDAGGTLDAGTPQTAPPDAAGVPRLSLDELELEKQHPEADASADAAPPTDGK
jgi:hypothetical protein